MRNCRTKRIGREIENSNFRGNSISFHSFRAPKESLPGPPRPSGQRELPSRTKRGRPGGCSFRLRTRGDRCGRRRARASAIVFATQGQSLVGALVTRTSARSSTKRHPRLCPIGATFRQTRRTDPVIPSADFHLGLSPPPSREFGRNSNFALTKSCRRTIYLQLCKN